MQELAIDLIKRAGNYIRKEIDHAYAIEEKTNRSDLVTEIDKEVERMLVKGIGEVYPDHGIFGEEGMAERPKTLDGTIWFVDPIDGTMNFIRQKRLFAISIAIMVDGVLTFGFVYDVMADELFHARRGGGSFMNGVRLERLEEKKVKDALLCMNATWVTRNRRIDPSLLGPVVTDSIGCRAIGAASLELAWVAAGRVDGYITMRNMPWDYAAGQLLIEELGGVVGSIEGTPMDFMGQTSVLAGSGTFVEDVLTYLGDEKNA